MYLMYNGPHEGAETYGEIAARGLRHCHPSRVDMIYPEFIARFKYNSKPYKRWINWLVKNATVEEYLELSKASTPVDAMKSLGCTASWL